MKEIVLKCTACICITVFCCILLYQEHLYLAIAIEILGIMGILGAILSTIETILEILIALFGG